jgi:hypothetical protein
MVDTINKACYKSTYTKEYTFNYDATTNPY